MRWVPLRFTQERLKSLAGLRKAFFKEERDGVDEVDGVDRSEERAGSDERDRSCERDEVDRMDGSSHVWKGDLLHARQDEMGEQACKPSSV